MRDSHQHTEFQDSTRDPSIEFLGDVSADEAQQISEVLHAIPGPHQVIALPRWTVFAEATGLRHLYFAVDNLNGGTYQGNTVDELVSKLRAIQRESTPQP